MFVLAILEDKIKIAPEKFDEDHTDMILEEIDQKYTNKVSLPHDRHFVSSFTPRFQVLIDVGLCISFYDIIKVGEPYIYPAEGSAHQKVKFRLGNVYVVVVLR